MLKKALVGIIIIFLITSLIKNVTEFRKNIKFYATYKETLRIEEERNNKLKMKAIKVNDPAELEKTIRNKLNFIKENEIAIIVPTPTSVPTTPTPTPKPNYQQWIDVFLK